MKIDGPQASPLLWPVYILGRHRRIDGVAVADLEFRFDIAASAVLLSDDAGLTNGPGTVNLSVLRNFKPELTFSN